MGTKTYNNYEDLLTFTRASKGHALRPVSYGDELVTNGTFDTDSDWTKQAGVTISGGKANVTVTSGGYQQIVQEVTYTAGKIYVLTATVNGTSGESIRFRDDISDNGGLTITTGAVSLTGTDQSVRFIFQATGSSSRVNIERNSSTNSYTFTVDDVSVKEVTFDESDGTLTLFEHPNNVPRVEYDADGNRLGLLVEESRTNLVTRSDATGWTVAAASATDNSETTLGAFTGAIVSSNGADWHRYRPANITVTSGTTYAVTLFYEYGTSGDVLLNFRDVSAANESRITGAWGSLTTPYQNAGTLTILEETALPQNVKKVVAKFVPNFSGNFEIGIGPHSNTSGETVIVYAAQCEQASFGTSYIKTTGSTATRSADLATMNLTEFGYNHSEGTVVVDASFTIDPNGSNYPRVFEFNTGTSSIDRTLLFASESSNTLQVSSFVNSVSQVGMQLKTGLTSSVSGKVAFAFANDDFAASDDGDAVLTDTSGSFVPSVKRDKLTLGGTGANSLSNMNGHIKSFKYYPRRLTNAQLQEITS